jgi:S-adenosylmethionine hydrolase
MTARASGRVAAALLTLAVLVGAGLGARSAATAQAPAPNGIVALLSDFGDDDYLAGALRGAVLSANVNARLVDVGNEVPSFDIREGAYWLQQAARYYPPGTVFLAIIDPAIATPSDRKLVAVTENGSIFVGPDNGLLSFALADAIMVQAYQLSAPELMAPGTLSVAPSFGRDVFRIYAHAAGRLAGGASPALAGPPVGNWTRLEIRPARLDQGTLYGEVLHVDHFGNLTTNLGAALATQAGFALGQPLTVTVGGRSVPATFARAFGDVPSGAYLVYVDENAVKVAINAGNAATGLGARAGAEVTVAPTGR